MNLRYLQILVNIYASSFSENGETTVANFTAVFHSEILARELREFITAILTEISSGIREELLRSDYNNARDVKIILYVSGDAYRSYIFPSCANEFSIQPFDLYWKVTGSYSAKLMNDLYALVSEIAGTERRTLPATPDLSTLTAELRARHYEIRHNN